MNNPPGSPSDAQVLAAVQENWDAQIDEVAYFAAGFGAHHWVGKQQGDVLLFITLDSPIDPQLLEASYAAAGEVQRTLPSVAIAPIPTSSGRFTSALDSGFLSVTPWATGITPESREALREQQHLKVKALLEKLHSMAAPVSLRAWTPAVDAHMADHISELTRNAWNSGPQCEIARTLITERLQDIESMNSRFQTLVEQAESQRDRWVPTHGEPHFANQIWIEDDVRLVDWESFRYAPPERDLGEITLHLRGGLQIDPEMLEMFRLEWSLAEITEYARWFSTEHEGNQDDLVALENLRTELDWS